MKPLEELKIARVQIKSLKELIEVQKHELQFYTQTHYSLPQIRVAIAKILDRPEMLPYMREQLKTNLQLELMLNEPPRGISNR